MTAGSPRRRRLANHSHESVATAPDRALAQRSAPRLRQAATPSSRAIAASRHRAARRTSTLRNSGRAGSPRGHAAGQGAGFGGQRTTLVKCTALRYRAVMNQTEPEIWIAACAHCLQKHWRTIDPVQLKDVARELLEHNPLGPIKPADAAALWLRPVAGRSDDGVDATRT